jgi:hypothetical protein
MDNSQTDDKVLIEAWASTSLDAVVGTDQQSNSYWNRISDYYKAHKQSSWPERNANALSCRFTTVFANSSKFAGCVQQILNKDESGRTLREKVVFYLASNICYALCVQVLTDHLFLQQDDAHLLYIAKHPKKKPFTLMHCYVEFQKYPKWQTREVSKKNRRRPRMQAQVQHPMMTTSVH